MSPEWLVKLRWCWYEVCQSSQDAGIVRGGQDMKFGERSKPEGAFICGINPCPGSPPLACRIGSTQEPLKSCCHPGSRWQSQRGWIQRAISCFRNLSWFLPSTHPPSSSPTTLTPCNCFTENSFSWLWSSPGCVQALPLCPMPPLCPWSFLPAHQKMPAKSFGSSGSAPVLHTQELIFLERPDFGIFPSGMSAEWSLILLIWIMSSDGDKWFLSRRFH